MLEEPMGLREIEPGLTVGGLPLVIAGQAPTMREPTEGALSDPATLPLNRFSTGGW